LNGIIGGNKRKRDKMMIQKFITIVIVFNFVFPYRCISQETSFNEIRAFDYLIKQCDFGPRNPGSRGHSSCRDFLIDELKKFSSSVVRQDFSYFDQELKKSIIMSNIIASFPSKKNSSEWVILSAHWDTRPRADKDKDPEKRDMPILGANDGASGVAVLLEIANILSQVEPQYSVDIVLFDGEDYGKEGDYDNYLLGSRYYAKNPIRDKYSFGFLLDMIGDKNLRIPKERFSYEYLPDLTNKTWKKAQALGIRQFVNIVGEEIFDDHQVLIEAGIPIIDIIDFDYSRYWHTTLDTPDKCSKRSLKAVGDLITAILYEGFE